MESDKFLLVGINAKYIHSNPAIYSLRGYLPELARQYVEVCEYTINQLPQEILRDLYTKKPRFIGFSCYIWNWRYVRELLRELPKLLPDTKLWLGGPEVSFDAPQILRDFPCLSGIMVGEGEETFRELVEYYLEEGKESLTEIAGLCLPEGYTKARESVSMDRLPFLYQDMEPFCNRIIYYESSRGCPYRCSYCLSSIDKSVRTRDIGVIKQELGFFLEKRVPQVKFVDRTFNCNHEHAMEIWSFINDNDNGVTNFHFEISADILLEDEIALLRRMRPGLVQLEIGVQSVNPTTLRSIRRQMNLERLKEVVATIREGNNIHQHLDLIAGLPYEDMESFQNSFQEVYSCRPQQLQLGFLKVLKGSPMQDEAASYGIVSMEEPPYEVLYTNWLSYDDIIRLKHVEEMVELYYNSNQFVCTLSLLEKCFENPFDLYDKLAKYYEAQGYLKNSPARAHRYEILLSFARAIDPEREEHYRQLLLFDLYLRENMKSRPSFAPPVEEPVKEQMRAIYQAEEKHQKYLPGYEQYDWKQMSKMTHLEYFTYPVWEALVEFSRDENQVLGQEGYVLFDYQKRNPLTGDASITVLSGE